jgi:ribose 5-phosphate isomerase B
MKIYIASDHAGVGLKQKLITSFPQYNFVNLGTDTNDSVDYPDYAQELCTRLLEDTASKGILICGSGIGMSIAANRFKGINAALVMNSEMASLSRKHNNSNILVLAAKFTPVDEAIGITKTWFDTEFEAGRHQSRVEKIDKC